MKLKLADRAAEVLRQGMIILVLLALAGGGGILILGHRSDSRPNSDVDLSGQNLHSGHAFSPTPTQWATLTVQPVEEHAFRSEYPTEGKIAVDEDQATPVFSPYAGRVTKLLTSPGATVARGEPLFVIEAADMVQAQNDFMGAVAAKNKARSQLNLAQTVETRMNNLYQSKAIALKDWQQSQADLTAAQNDLRSAEAALEAVRNRLRILGKTDDEIATFEDKGTINSATTIYAPIAGTVVQRKVGPGQYIAAGSSDPVFVIGDLSKVWLLAFMRETNASKVQIGQPIKFTVLAYPDRVFEGKINYVASSLDPNSRRLLVSATIDNSGALLKPEMFANVRVITDEGAPAPAIPREAIIYEGDVARVWVALDDKSIELRQVRLGRADGQVVEVLDGLKTGDRVITKGSLFIDRAATSGES
jgi:cobalt-zinc-cadmium efflux system membrane fusion protein